MSKVQPVTEAAMKLTKELTKTKTVIVPDGAAIRARRLCLGKTLASVAKAIGVSSPFLSDVELGRRGMSQETLDKLVKVLK